jgi:hypothetical protein
MGVLGTAAHATHFVVLPALGATLLLLRWNYSRRLATLFWSGLLYGLAVLMKQPGALFAIFGALYLLWSQRRELRSRRVEVLLRFGLFTLAGFLPLAITCLILWHAGVFPKFWFWTVTYARAYGSVISPSGGVLTFLRKVKQIIMSPNAALWLLGAAGMVLTWIGKRHRASALWATAFLVFSFLAVCPGFNFREHYFILMLPAVALMAGAAVAVVGDYLPGGQQVALFAVVVALSVIPQRHFLFDMGDTELLRSTYAENPFLEAVAVADYIKNHAGKDARVAVIGSEPEIYFYAQRRSVTDYIYTYALGEPQPFALQMQDEMIRDIEAANPEYIVAVNVPGSWLFLPGYCQIDGVQGPKYCDIFRVADRISTTNTVYRLDIVTRTWLFRPSSPTRIFDWFADYGPKNYDIVGVADIISTTNTVYRWDDAAAAYQPQSPSFLRIFKRKS